MKVIYPLILLIFVLTSCDNQEERAEFQRLKDQERIEQQNKEMIEYLFKSFNERNIEGFKSVTDPEWQYFHPSTNANAVSRDEMITRLENAYASFTSISFKVDKILASGENVVVSYSSHHIHPSGKEAKGSAIILYTIKNGKVTEVREEFNVEN